MARIVVLEDCEHGEFRAHWLGTGYAERCYGYRRRVLDPGSYVLIEKVDGLWPLWAYSTLNEGSSIDSILDALAGGEQPSIRERAERAGIADRISDQSGYNWPPPGVDEAGGEQP